MTENVENIALQPEIWNKILLKLWENEEDLETLLTCRLVCRSWEELIDKMPPKLHWNPWLRDDVNARDIFEKVPATSFKTDEDITQFSSFMAELSSDEVKKNYFCNKTVKLFDQQNQVSSDEMEKLHKLLEEHGHHIHQLYYSPPAPLLNGKVTRFPPLLSTMTNLRTLAVNLLDTTEEQRRAINRENFPKHLENLQELVIRAGNRESVQAFGWFSYLLWTKPIYEKFSINYGSQIKSLTLDLWTLQFDRFGQNSFFERFPNLEQFKLEKLCVLPRIVLGTAFKFGWRKLKRLAFGTYTFTGDSNEFGKVLWVVCHFSETLEVLSLHFYSFGLLDSGLERVRVAPNNTYPTPFPKLEKLILPFRFMCFKGQPYLVPLETRLNVRLPILKFLVLDDMEDGFKNRKISGVELSEICSQLWRLLPPSVETISLRVFRTNEALDRDFPVIYKCQRVRLSGWQA